MINATPFSTMLQNFDPVDTSRPDILTADPDIIKYSVFSLPAEIMAELILQDIGGIEFLLLSRHDNVSGRSVDTRRVSNLWEINTEFGPKVLGSLESDVRGARFGLAIDTYIGEGEPVSTDGDYITILVEDVPYGYEVEATMEPLKDSLTFGAGV